MTHQSIILVAHTAFGHPPDSAEHGCHIKPLILEGFIEEVVLEAHLVHRNYKFVSSSKMFIFNVVLTLKSVSTGKEDRGT